MALRIAFRCSGVSWAAPAASSASRSAILSRTSSASLSLTTARIALRCSGVSWVASGRTCADAVARLSTMVAAAAELASNIFVYFVFASDLIAFS